MKIENETTAFRSKKRILLSGLLTWVLLGAGCGQGSTPETKVTPPNQQFESQIQAIQNNPKMPPDAKQRAIATLKAQQAASGPGKSPTQP